MDRQGWRWGETQAGQYRHAAPGLAIGRPVRERLASSKQTGGKPRQPRQTLSCGIAPFPCPAVAWAYLLLSLSVRLPVFWATRRRCVLTWAWVVSAFLFFPAPLPRDYQGTAPTAFPPVRSPSRLYFFSQQQLQPQACLHRGSSTCRSTPAVVRGPRWKRLAVVPLYPP